MGRNVGRVGGYGGGVGWRPAELVAPGRRAMRCPCRQVRQNPVDHRARGDGRHDSASGQRSWGTRADRLRRSAGAVRPSAGSLRVIRQPLERHRVPRTGVVPYRVSRSAKAVSPSGTEHTPRPYRAQGTRSGARPASRPRRPTRTRPGARTPGAPRAGVRRLGDLVSRLDRLAIPVRIAIVATSPSS